MEKPLKTLFSLEGNGLHTGLHSKITLKPMNETSGIIFLKKVGNEFIEIKADSKNVTTTTRSTTIGVDGNEIKTIEHLMSAIYSIGIDDLYIEVEGEEIPILDGSGKIFYEELIKAGIENKDSEKEYFVIDELLEFKVPETGSEFIAMPSDKFEVSVLIDFNSKLINKQFAEMRDIGNFYDEFAQCRTFGFFSEIEQLLDQGLVKGGSLENALVIADKELSDEDIKRFAAKLNIKDIKLEENGFLSARPMRFENEPARHKLLDFVGDISLIGMPLKGKFIIKKPGHKANYEFGKFLKQIILKQKKLKGRPHYDPNQPSILDINEIAEILPHRYPFLLVDKVIEISDSHIVGIKNLTFNEMLFQGHFPNNPIFPGVLQIEALAQTGGLLALSLQEEKNGWDTYFLKIDNVKFKNMAIPGDTLVMKLELMDPIRRGIVHMKGTIFVGDKLISEGELTAQIVKRNNGN
ncbi:MAG: bifunctional UDP-3-O-[3-hydroxymyristoyl] N-acetylglucosamine deacetylase/3-hydroxyacyl-ACP dehydratase [Saprospiraceae bacterium]